MLAGLALGAAVGLVLGAPLAFGVARWVSKPTLDAWRLEPVVVAAVDLELGATVTMEHLSQRSMPVRFTNAAAIRPDEASKLIGARTMTVISAGTSLSWWMVSTAPGDGGAPSDCVETLRALSADAGTPAVKRLIDALESQRTTP
ncbi:MAG: SAF domain-containing protein [Myxococcaceae bacterium]